jgi:hypothetical protein
LDETFDKLKCMDGINSKIVMIDKNHITWMKVTRRMKYLDECGAWMNFWMIIGSRQIVWIKLSTSWMHGWK